jgi:transcriptional regulator NrdR family protein
MAAGASATGTDMKCPVCKAWVQVKETRQRPDNAIYRRYECANSHRFVTNEAVTKVIPIRNAEPK